MADVAPYRTTLQWELWLQVGRFDSGLPRRKPYPLSEGDETAHPSQRRGRPPLIVWAITFPALISVFASIPPWAHSGDALVQFHSPVSFPCQPNPTLQNKWTDIFL
jgi:hypothetical protein